MNNLSLEDRRELAFRNLQRMSRRRRKMLGRFLDNVVELVHPSNNEVLESLKDLRQFCELPGEFREQEKETP